MLSAWLLLESPATQAELTEAPVPPVSADACTADPECDRHYLQAQVYSKSGQLSDALIEYQAAYASRPSVRLLYNIARLNHRLGRPKEAISAYRAYLAIESGTEPTVRKRSQDYLAELERATPPVATPPAPAPVPAPVAAVPNPDVAVLVAGNRRPNQTSESKPIYKRWWLWTAVGAVVAGGTIGIIVGSLVDPRAKPSQLLDLRGQL